MAYNPFDKPFGEKIEEADLQVLISRQVVEGYYVEYKSEIPKTEKIGRSLASLANTYGGWYIVGVIADKKHNVATAIPGFDPESCHDPISTVRDLLKTHIDPVPIFYPQVVQLDNGNLVLLVYVPGEQATPFVTRDGRIYRRTHDSSDPVPENSRHALDQLVERGKNSAKRFEEFSKDERTLSKAENHGWLSVYISPYPFGVVDRLDVIMSSEGAKTLLARSNQSLEIRFSTKDTDKPLITGNIPFNVACPSPFSIMLIQRNINSEHFNSLSMELDINGRAKFHVPLPYSYPGQIDLSSIRSNSLKQALYTRTRQQDGSSLRFLDISKIWLAIISLCTFYLDWLGVVPSLFGFDVAMSLKNTWRYVPFCDLDLWATHIDEFGLPVIMLDNMRIPPNGSYRYENDSTLWTAINVNVALAFGLPPDFYSTAFGQSVVNASNLGG